MPTPPTRKQHSAQDKQRVMNAVARGDADWLTVARHNDIPKSTAYRVISTGRSENLPRGCARVACTKVTPAILASLEKYLQESCEYTLQKMGEMIFCDHQVRLSRSVN